MASAFAWDECNDVHCKQQAWEAGQAVSPARSKASNASSACQVHLWASRSSVDRSDQV